MTKKASKPKKCRVCKTLFTPNNIGNIVCSIKCALLNIEQTKSKKAKKQNREAKQKLKTKSDHLRECQQIVNRYIRLRDKELPCISCQRFHEGQYHASHYRSTGACPELRFCEDNIHRSCAPCNNHLSGNIVEYRINLINKIGIEKVEWLESKHEPKKYTIDDIKVIKALYKLKCKKLEGK